MSDDVSDFRNFFASFQNHQYPNNDPTEDSSTKLIDAGPLRAAWLWLKQTT